MENHIRLQLAYVTRFPKTPKETSLPTTPLTSDSPDTTMVDGRVLEEQAKLALDDVREWSMDYEERTRASRSRSFKKLVSPPLLSVSGFYFGLADGGAEVFGHVVESRSLADVLE